MQLRRELLAYIGLLVALNLLLAFGAIGLFVRMGPAIERILDENVRSIVAAEQVLSRLADDAALTPVTRAQVHDALATAERNVTEEGESAAISTLQAALPDALEGDATARREAVAALRDLSEINRTAMDRADSDARSLGSAGAWSAVFIGGLSFLLSVLVVSRLESRFIRPLSDLHEVVVAARRGERLRRCQLLDAPHEVVQVAEAVNELLDERLAAKPGDIDRDVEA